MMTSKERAIGITKHLENPNFPGYTILMPIDVIREAIAAMIDDAVKTEREACAQKAIDFSQRLSDHLRNDPSMNELRYGLDHLFAALGLIILDKIDATPPNPPETP